MPRRHAAIVRRRYADLLQSGIKTIESRLYRQRRPPYDRIRAGDLIYFKLTGGDVFGAAEVLRIRQYDDLTPADVRRIRRRFNHAVCGEPAYWAAKRRARYAVLIWLDGMRLVRKPPRLPRQFGNGWLILRSVRRRRGSDGRYLP